METNSCLFCRSEKYSPSFIPSTIFNETKYEYRQCDNCNLNYIHPPLSEKAYEKLYGSTYHESFYFNEEKSHSHVFRILKNRTSQKKLLDFGCGDGGFLRKALRMGFSCQGVEFSSALVERLQKENKEGHFFTADHFFKETTTQYDIIHLGDVLEHMMEPIVLLDKLKKRLVPDGILILEGPLEANLNGAFLLRKWMFKIKKIFNPTWVARHEPYHTFFSTYRNQIDFLEKNGFRTIYTKVLEDAWPFTAKWSDINSISTLLKYLIGKFSIGLSWMVPHWGNRLIYLGRCD